MGAPRQTYHRAGIIGAICLKISRGEKIIKITGWINYSNDYLAQKAIIQLIVCAVADLSVDLTRFWVLEKHQLHITLHLCSKREKLQRYLALNV